VKRKVLSSLLFGSNRICKASEFQIERGTTENECTALHNGGAYTGNQELATRGGTKRSKPTRVDIGQQSSLK